LIDNGTECYFIRFRLIILLQVNLHLVRIDIKFSNLIINKK